MKTFFEAYRERLERNHNDLFKLADEVLEKDPTIEVYHHHEDKFQSSITFFKDEMINSVSFHEVPYRWSGCGVKEHYGFKTTDGTIDDNLKMPFTVQDVVSTFKPVTNVKWKQPNEYFKTKEQYLKWCSYLKRYVQ